MSTPDGSVLGNRRLYLCTPDRADLERFVAACVRGGVDVVQLRAKELDARQVLDRGRLLLRLCTDLGVPFVLNDRPDLALELGADGVHVGQDDAPVALARRIVGEDRVVGLSTHAPLELAAALAGVERLDYVSVGPVVATPTKPGRPGTGLGYVAYAAPLCSKAGVPMFVTGDARPETVADMVAAGATRLVAVRWLTEAAEPESAARRLAGALSVALEQAGSKPAGS